ncbi:MAG: MFS transporter [Thermomicrobiales bacterium]|nr:MFS transporter [Thermomicrobiales bacterium]MCO5220419.1 MFS transporter [Thermomicrobiales bacterium]
MAEPRSYRHVLSNTQFRNLWAGTTFSGLGEAIGQVALPLLVYDMTSSAALMSVIFVLQMAPRALLSPFAGVVADNLDRRAIMLAANTLRGIAVAFIPFVESPAQLGAIAVLLGLGQTFAMPASLAVLPTIVTKETLVPSLSLVQVTGSITRIVGPALGAAIVGLVGPRPPFWLQAVCYGIAIFWNWRLVLPERVRPSSHAFGSIARNAAAEIRVGFRTIWTTPILRGVCLTEGLWSLIFGVLSITMVVYFEETLDLGTRADFLFGLSAVAMSSGAVIGALSASRLERRISRANMLFLGYLGPLLLVPVVLVPQPATLYILVFIFGVADAWAVISMQAYMAEWTADELRGRVYAIWGGVIAASALVAFSIVGWITDALGPPRTIALTGLIVGLSGPIGLVLTGALRSVLTGTPPDPIRSDTPK